MQDGMFGAPARQDGMFGAPARQDGMFGAPARQDGMFGAPARFFNSSICVLSMSPTLAESLYVSLTKFKEINLNTTFGNGKVQTNCVSEVIGCAPISIITDEFVGREATAFTIKTEAALSHKLWS